MTGMTILRVSRWDPQRSPYVFSIQARGLCFAATASRRESPRLSRIWKLRRRTSCGWRPRRSVSECYECNRPLIPESHEPHRSSGSGGDGLQAGERDTGAGSLRAHPVNPQPTPGHTSGCHDDAGRCAIAIRSAGCQKAQARVCAYIVRVGIQRMAIQRMSSCSHWIGDTRLLRKHISMALSSAPYHEVVATQIRSLRELPGSSLSLRGSPNRDQNAATTYGLGVSGRRSF
ncbi:uncharacterized protein C8Q71DRAFT_275422 [Rhodofomes roseus]|uniref:Uncharacterized protein n=1 Tax=Rhodofomes roseus TaxID=34475 RepID=A0ABQ8K4U2_9APHY|nr:uncharacterized protein C8Q71DRAFT_275422 [Rhodofomes roseus]KAH9831977.1 hypothetical protein C8Q71DRAFT_275422 [Rhodofomes roseus]